MIPAGPREILHLLSEVASVRFRAALPGGAHQDHREARVERHRHQRGLPKTRNTFDAHAVRVHRRVGFQIVESAGSAPPPRPQRAPVLRLSCLSLIGQTDDALRQACAVVRLNAARIKQSVTPSSGDQLFHRRWIGAQHRLQFGTAGEHVRHPLQKRRAAEHHHHGYWPFRVGWRHQCHIDVHTDRRAQRVVRVPGQMLLSYRKNPCP